MKPIRGYCRSLHHPDSPPSRSAFTRRIQTLRELGLARRKLNGSAPRNFFYVRADVAEYVRANLEAVEP